MNVTCISENADSTGSLRIRNTSTTNRGERDRDSWKNVDASCEDRNEKKTAQLLMCAETTENLRTTNSKKNTKTILRVSRNFWNVPGVTNFARHSIMHKNTQALRAKGLQRGQSKHQEELRLRDIRELLHLEFNTFMWYLI